MIDADVFRDQPTLTGERVRLEPLTQAVLADYLAVLDDPEVQRLTGSHEPTTGSRSSGGSPPGRTTTTGPTGPRCASPTEPSSARP